MLHFCKITTEAISFGISLHLYIAFCGMTCEYGCVLTLVVKLAPKSTEVEESSVNKVYFKDRGELGRAPQPIACGHMDGLH